MKIPRSAGKSFVPLFTEERGSPVTRHRGHFRFNIISVLMALISAVAGLILQAVLWPQVSFESIAVVLAAAAAAMALLTIVPYWTMAIISIAGFWAVPMFYLGDVPFVLAAALSAGFFLAPGFEIINQWDKLVILRLGRFNRVRGPGLAFLLPMIDSAAGYVDTRIRVTDFSAEKSLTLDTVPVHVDALAFWMIWDAEKAILEVQDYQAAVSLSAQTALRASIGSNTLTALLRERERMGEEIQRLVDAKTNPWGISIVSVEFKEILVPGELEDALSREAQAERERAARVILGSTEAEIASSFRKAADQYRDDPTALQLRAMNMIYEGIRNKGGLILTPASALDGMNLGAVLGAAAYGAKNGILPPDMTGGGGGLNGPGAGRAPASNGAADTDSAGGGAGGGAPSDDGTARAGKGSAPPGGGAPAGNVTGAAGRTATAHNEAAEADGAVGAYPKGD